ncbi:MAG: hypothetical protein PUP91_32990 [Rhizonema sp. PD37]|nr:hypothetical protein [Rhizonema sp. PD37]
MNIYLSYTSILGFDTLAYLSLKLLAQHSATPVASTVASAVQGSVWYSS